MTEIEKEKCHVIIHGAATAAAAAAAGLAQLPGSDNAIIVPIQVAMITSLGHVFDISLSESATKSILATALATITGRAISQLFVGWIPILGNAINASTAFAITEKIGWHIADDFSSESHSKSA